MYVYNVAKAYNNGGQIRQIMHPRGAKKYWNLYFYDKSGLFHRKRITWYKALYYKLFFEKKKWRTIVCPICKRKLRYLGKPYCPYCVEIL